MLRRTLKTGIAVIAAAACMVGTAMAAQQVTNYSDKPIEPKSACSHAGSMSLEFPRDTTIHEGDAIRYLVSTGATICGDIDYFLALADNGQMVIANGSADPVQCTNANAALFDLEVYQNNVALGAGALTDRIGFWVSATNGGSTITLTLARQNIATGVVSIDSTVATGYAVKFVASTDSDKLTVKFFDGNNLAAFYYEPADRTTAPTVYDDNIGDTDDLADNILCLNTLNYTGNQVYAVPESRPISNTYQLTFLGDFIIQQVIAAVEYKVDVVGKDATCNYIPLTTSVDQQGNSVAATGLFDFGTYDAEKTVSDLTNDRWDSSNYCVSSKIGNGILFYKDGAVFASGDQFKVTMTIRVGASADAKKITFAAANPNGAEYWTVKGNAVNTNSSADPTAATANLSKAVATTTWAYAGKAPDTNTVASAVYTAADIKKGALMFDLAALQLTLKNVAAGEKVYLDVAVSKLPCGGAIATNTICLGELVNTCPVTVNSKIDGIVFVGDRSLTKVLHGYLGRQANDIANSSLLFPYATAMNDEDFFTGISITNVGTSSVKLTFKMTDANGGTATYTYSGLGAGKMVTKTLDSLPSSTDYKAGSPALDMTQNIWVKVDASAE